MASYSITSSARPSSADGAREQQMRDGDQWGMPSNFGIALRSLTHPCCERTNICRRGGNSFRWRTDPSRTL
jgi:hypothetical protein